ncbi:MAG: heavy-metal-associated domain-containing protein, partial [Mucilaginibacter sp.]|nr:heavy-metal-associated domain-containing protein [Mucilaginibacter sp.]
MKTFKIFIAILAFTATAAHAQFIKAELQVNGLTCSLCSKATEKSLRTLDFIGDIKVDLNRNIFLLTFKKEASVNLDQISKKVENAGFFVNNLKATFNFDNVKVLNNYFSYTGNTYYLINAGNKALTGLLVFTVVDKGFAPASVYKKYSAVAADNRAGKVYKVI